MVHQLEESGVEKKTQRRGRPKGKSSDNRSFGPLGDLIRKHRMSRNLGLMDVAQACGCSVQFISNIEHGRAPLPWNKAELLSKALRIPLEELRAANLAIRSDFQSFMTTSSKRMRRKVNKNDTAVSQPDVASVLALTADNPQLVDLLVKVHAASAAERKKFYATAKRLLNS